MILGLIADVHVIRTDLELNQDYFALIFPERSQHFEGLELENSSLLALIPLLSERVSFDDHLAGSLNMTMMRVGGIGSKSKVSGIDRKEDRPFSILGVMLFDLFQGLDEAMTIFPLLFVAKLNSHLYYYRKVPAEVFIKHKYD